MNEFFSMISAIKDDLLFWGTSIFAIFKTTIGLITSSAIVLTFVIIGVFRLRKHN